MTSAPTLLAARADIDRLRRWLEQHPERNGLLAIPDTPDGSRRPPASLTP